jgi:hypothetical protein
VINEISLVGARMFNVINNGSRFIKHIQNKFFGGVDVIMIGDFYEAPLVKDNWNFQNIKNNINALTLNFWQIHVQCYELNKVMRQDDMVFLQTMNKFRIVVKKYKEY